MGIPLSLSYYGSSKPKKMKDLSCRLQDDHKLIIYFGTGCVHSDYVINHLMMKYPQFNIYDKASRGSAFNRLKKQANSLSFERRNKKNGELFLIKKLILSNAYIYNYKYHFYFNDAIL